MACQPNEAGVLAGMSSTDPAERLDAVNTALALGLDSAAVGSAAVTVVNNETDGTLGPAIVNGAIQLAGNVGAKHPAMESFLTSVVANPPIISFQSTSQDCTPPPYANPGDPYPIDPLTGVMWDPNSGNPYPPPICAPATSTTTLDTLDNTSNIKAAAVSALETMNETNTLPESTVDSLIDNLEADVTNAADEDVPKLERHASATFKLCSRVSKKVDKKRRNKMGNKIRNKFYSPSKKKLGCGPAAYVGDIIKDMGDDAPPLDPNNPNEQDILEVMDNCGPSAESPGVSMNCPSSRVKTGTEIDLAPTITNGLGEIVMSSGAVVGDVTQMQISIDFGDGSASTSTFAHAFNSPGQYSMVLSVVDNATGYSTVETCDVTIYNPVQVSIGDPVPSVVNPGDNVDVPVYTDGSVIVVPPNVTIDPPGGVVTVVAPEPPDQLVLTFTDPFGDPAEPPEIIVPVVIALAPLEVTLSTDDIMCEGSDKEFSVDVSGAIDGYTVMWTIDGTSGVNDDIIVTSFTAGPHTVSALITDGTGRTVDSGPLSFEIYPRYSAYISSTSLPSGTGVVPGLTINFDVCVSLCSGDQPEVKPVIDTTGTFITPDTVVFPGPGVYPVTATLPDVDITVTENVTVYGAPVIDMTHALSAVCEGLVVFTVDVSGGHAPEPIPPATEGYVIFFDAGDGVVYQVLNHTTLEHQYRAHGLYVVSLTVKDADDIVSSVSVAVQV